VSREAAHPSSHRDQHTDDQPYSKIILLGVLRQRHGRRVMVTGVSVQLGSLFTRTPSATRHVITTGLDLTGAAKGQLQSASPVWTGDWLGCPPGCRMTVDRGPPGYGS
jgi:hypothetical protein